MTTPSVYVHTKTGELAIMWPRIFAGMMINGYWFSVKNSEVIRYTILSPHEWGWEYLGEL
jgi:hypothetical protein